MSNRIYGTLEKKIARCLARLPSKHLLALTKTREQMRSWLVQRYFQQLLSLCWRARHSGEDDPISGLVRSGKINQDIYDRIWLMVEFWEQIWGLVQLAAPYIQEEIEKLGLEYPFKNAFELFATIIWEESNSTFSVCLKPYYEVSALKYERACRLASKSCKEILNPIEERRLHGLLNQQPNMMWMALTLSICHQKATRQRIALKTKLELFYVALGKLCDKEATISRKTSSFAWKDGKLGSGDKDGIYKFP